MKDLIPKNTKKRIVAGHQGRGVDSPPNHLDTFEGAPRRLPKPLSDQFPVCVCSCPLCIINRLYSCKRRYALRRHQRRRYRR